MIWTLGTQWLRAQRGTGPSPVARRVVSAVPCLNWEPSNKPLPCASILLPPHPTPPPHTFLAVVLIPKALPGDLCGHRPFQGSLRGLPLLWVGPSLLKGQAMQESQGELGGLKAHYHRARDRKVWLPQQDELLPGLWLVRNDDDDDDDINSHAASSK